MWVLLLLFCFIPPILTQHVVTYLESWEIQSSVNLTKPWYPVQGTVTVLAGLTQAGVYKDPYYDLNLQSIDASLFTGSWHYRTSFNVDAADQGSTFILVLKGINYRANIDLNGAQIGSQTNIVGTFRYFEFDVTKSLQYGASNTLELEIFPPSDSAFDSKSKDLALTFVDWAPTPPDNNMGLWREVELIKIAGPVSLRYPLVTTTSLDANQANAKLTVVVEAWNTGTSSVTGVVGVNIEGVGSFQQSVTLAANAQSKISFPSTSYNVLNIASPRVWWPWQMGSQELYNITFNFTINSVASDVISARFGIRQMTDEVDSNGHRLYKVNGKNILIRGGGYSPDLFLTSETNRTWQNLVLKLTRDLNLNAIRFEGKHPSDSMYELADEQGILMIAGWCCCDAWQHWNVWGTEQYTVAEESTRSQAKRLRIHASILAFWYSSDELPPTDVEQDYLNVFKAELWPNPLLASASDYTSSISGPTGVKMSGPYSWVPPNYWETDPGDVGGAFGFLTEGGPGEAPLSLESQQVTIPASKLWPINFDWDFHCGGQQGNFGNLDRFTDPLNSRYGTSASAADYLRKSQAAAYEGHRAMFEGYSRNKYTSTGVVQWMLNNAFPDNIWHLFDYYLSSSPGSYWGTKKANELLHIQYSYDDNSIWVVNSLYKASAATVAGIYVYSNTGASLYTHNVSVSAVPSDGTVKIFTLPTISGLTTTYFLRLELNDTSSKRLSVNDYWLSTVPDVLNWKASTWYNTPCKSYADLTELAKLPTVSVTSTNATVKINNDAQYQTTVTVTNPSTSVAFLVHVRLVSQNTAATDLNPADVRPLFWDDNYITLFAHESRTITATYDVASSGYQVPNVVVEVFNNIK